MILTEAQQPIRNQVNDLKETGRESRDVGFTQSICRGNESIRG